jgi:hypothetical protein
MVGLAVVDQSTVRRVNASGWSRVSGGAAESAESSPA